MAHDKHAATSLGASGLKVTKLWLGAMMFGDQTDEAEAGRIDERTVLAVLTHDPKFDVPVLEVALRLQVAYVGAMGSRRTHQDRLARLLEAGMSEAELARLSSPIGLDLGARTPEETAVSIAAEVIQLRWGGHGRRLTELAGPIHHQGAHAEPAAHPPGPVAADT